MEPLSPQINSTQYWARAHIRNHSHSYTWILLRRSYKSSHIIKFDKPQGSDYRETLEVIMCWNTDRCVYLSKSDLPSLATLFQKNVSICSNGKYTELNKYSYWFIFRGRSNSICGAGPPCMIGKLSTTELQYQPLNKFLLTWRLGCNKENLLGNMFSKTWRALHERRIFR